MKVVIFTIKISKMRFFSLFSFFLSLCALYLNVKQILGGKTTTYCFQNNVLFPKCCVSLIDTIIMLKCNNFLKMEFHPHFQSIHSSVTMKTVAFANFPVTIFLQNIDFKIFSFFLLDFTVSVLWNRCFGFHKLKFINFQRL